MTKEERERLLLELYTSGAGLIEAAQAAGFSLSTAIIRLKQADVYDRPINKGYIEQIWPQWEAACKLIRNGGKE